jgi:hypothetical protein
MCHNMMYVASSRLVPSAKMHFLSYIVHLRILAYYKSPVVISDEVTGLCLSPLRTDKRHAGMGLEQSKFDAEVTSILIFLEENSLQIDAHRRD